MLCTYCACKSYKYGHHCKHCYPKQSPLRLVFTLTVQTGCIVILTMQTIGHIHQDDHAGGQVKQASEDSYMHSSQQDSKSVQLGRLIFVQLKL